MLCGVVNITYRCVTSQKSRDVTKPEVTSPQNCKILVSCFDQMDIDLVPNMTVTLESPNGLSEVI